ncbi:hypothetical protein E1301_Tti019185 [Triplophysa tibetana]|uniref:Uncharacterized protein n=1 Tax=Triplophysa tibetana TaxID=1572043 RepID=A0A5A9P3W6_9TELE|nr:hypothetical protein E1301_Tti019185 [Triplophysa tibetana]
MEVPWTKSQGRGMGGKAPELRVLASRRFLGGPRCLLLARCWLEVGAALLREGRVAGSLRLDGSRRPGNPWRYLRSRRACCAGLPADDHDEPHWCIARAGSRGNHEPCPACRWSFAELTLPCEVRKVGAGGHVMKPGNLLQNPTPSWNALVSAGGLQFVDASSMTNSARLQEAP